MPPKEDQNQQGQTKKNYRYDFRNGIYEGGVVQYKRQGFGIVLLDDGFVYIGGWKNDKVNGRSLLFIPNIGIIYGNFVNGIQIGLQIVKLYKQQNEYFIVDIKDPLKAPQSVIIYFRDSKSAVQAIIEDKTREVEWRECGVCKEQEYLIDELQNLSMRFESGFRKAKNFVDNCGTNVIKIGYMSNDNKMNGIGLLIDQQSFQVLKSGVFVDDALQGLAYIKMNNQDIYQGMVHQDCIHGKGFYYTASNSSYVFSLFKNGQSRELISDGINYPTSQILKFKQSVHESSIHFFSSSLQSRDFININWSYLCLFNENNNLIKLEQKRNFSPSMSSTMLDKFNTPNTGRNNSSTKTHTFQHESTTSSNGHYPFQQNLQSSNYLNGEDYKITQQNGIEQLTKRRTDSINSYRHHQNTQNDTLYNQQSKGVYDQQHKVLYDQQSKGVQDQQSKYSRKYTMANREQQQVENPESYTEIDFGKLNWGVPKPKTDHYPFSHINYTVEKEGQKLFECLGNDKVYKRESQINYYQENIKVPSYQDSIKEGNIIKKRIQEIKSLNQVNQQINQISKSFNQLNEQIPNQENNNSTNRLYCSYHADNIYIQQDNNSAQKYKHNSNKQSEKTMYRSPSINSISQTKQFKQNPSFDYSLISSSLSNENENILARKVQELKPNKNDYENNAKEQNINEYQDNGCENDQERYVNQKIEIIAQPRLDKPNRHLILHPPQSGNTISISSKSEQYSIQYDNKKRSYSMSSSNYSYMPQPLINTFCTNKENSPNIISASIQNTYISNNQIKEDSNISNNTSKDLVNYQISSSSSNKNNENNNQNVIKSLNNYDDKQKNKCAIFTSNTINNKNTIQQQKQDIQQNQQVQMSEQVQTNKLQQPMKFIQTFGMPHQNKNDQVGIFLKMKEESINRQNEILLSTNQNFDVTPVSHINPNQYQQSNLNSSRLSILYSYMNPENDHINNESNSIQSNSITSEVNIPKQNCSNKSNQPRFGSYKKEEMPYYMGIEDGKSGECVFTFNNNNQSSSMNNNQSSLISNNSYNQIPNEFDWTQSTRPQSAILQMKERHQIKLNNILHSSQIQTIPILNWNPIQGYNVPITENKGEQKIKSFQYPTSSYNTPYMQTNPNFYEKEQINSMKDKSLVRFNLNSEPPQRHKSFSQNRQQTPEKSSLKYTIQTNNIDNKNKNIITNKSNQRLSNSIDQSKRQYFQSENPTNQFQENSKNKIQNQWLDINTINPQIMFSSSPINKIVENKYIQNSHQNQKQYLPIFA